MLRPLVVPVAAAALLVATLFSSAAAAQERTSSTKLLPPNVYAYFAAPDAETLKERMDESAFGSLLKDPNLQPILDQIKEKIGESGGQVQEKLGVTLDELMKVPAGEVAIAVCDVPGGEIGLVFFVDYGDGKATVDKLIERAEAELKKKNATRRVETFEGTEVIVHETKKEVLEEDDLDIEGEEPTSTKADKIAWFQKDNRFVLGNDVPILEAVLARWSGDHDETFANSEVYAAITEKTRTDDREPALVFFVDPIGGLQAALSRADNLPPMAQMFTLMLPGLGVTNLKGIGGSVDVATQDYDSITKVFFYVEEPPSGDLGVLAVFNFTPAELAPPEWVSDAATGYFGANWNITGALESIQRLVDTANGPGAFNQLMQRAANAPNGPKINPKTDLLDQLTGMVHVVNYPVATPRVVQDDNEALAQQQPVVVALDLKDEAKMTEVLTRIANTPNFPGESRDFQGATVYELPTRNPRGGEAGKTALTVAKGHLFFATDVSRLEDVLREDTGNTLADNENYQEIAGRFPDEASMIGYQDQRVQLKTVYEALRSGRAGQQLGGIDFTKLPEFDQIAKYLRSTGSYAVPDQNGALFVSFALKLDE